MGVLDGGPSSYEDNIGLMSAKLDTGEDEWYGPTIQNWSSRTIMAAGANNRIKGGGTFSKVNGQLARDGVSTKTPGRRHRSPTAVPDLVSYGEKNKDSAQQREWGSFI